METKKKIMSKAMELFHEQGFDRTPMSRIAKELGLSKAGLFHHYPKKEDLLFDVIQHIHDTSFLQFYEDAKKISDPEERILFVLGKFCETNTSNASTRIGVHEASRLPSQQQEILRRNWQRALNLLRDAISELQAQGKAKKMNSTFAAFAAIGMFGWIYYWFDYSRKESDEELLETFIEIFMRGIRQE
jgi:AcrR family transcriptional regulator